MAGSAGGAEAAEALKIEGNSHYKSGNYLKAAAVYTQAIKADPSNATLYSNRSAAFFSLLKVTKALSDAETTIKLKPSWEKGYFRKGCALEGAERYEEALKAYREASEKNPQSSEVNTKIKRLTQMVRDKKRNQDKQAAKLDSSKTVTGLDQLQLDLVEGAPSNVNTEDLFKLLKEVVEAAIQTWSDSTGKLDPGVRFWVPLLKGTTGSEYVQVSIEKAFESPDTFHNCVFSLQEYAVDMKAKAACLVVQKRTIAFPQIWNGQGARKWKWGNSNGLFVQLESPALRRVWFIPSSVEKGQNVCRSPELLDLDVHSVLPPLFKS